MNVKAAFIVICAMSTAFAQDVPSGFHPKPRADTIFLHGNIYTGVAGTLSPGVIRAQAIAVRGDRIQAIGKDEDITALKGPDTQVVDLGGHFVMPGFNDAHVHLAGAGFQKQTVDLSGVKSLSEFRERIRVRAATAAPGEWITGAGWDQTKWPLKALPSRQDVDAVTADHPVFLERTDGHIAVANTRALQLAGITPASKDPMGGRIDRDVNGQPTGILREGAKDAVFAVIPPPTHAKRRQAVEAALQEVASYGITSIQDNSSWEDFQIYEEIEKEGKLRTRISEWLSFQSMLDKLREQRAAHPSSDTMLHTGMLKGFMDGSLGSRTAALLEPYADDPKNTGLPQFEEAKLIQMTKERVEDGFQIGFHAIGDKGVQMALDAFAEAEKDLQGKRPGTSNGTDNLRLRIEHAQVTSPAQIVQFQHLKVIASMQPCHLLTDMNWAQSRLGPERAAHSYAWAELLKQGVILAFGTDYPVESVSPFRGLYAAVTRKSEDGEKEYFPEQRLTVEQAIAAYTSGSAFAEFAEKDKGMLEVGKLADFTVLDRDIAAVPAEKILGTKVLRTVVGGKTVYEAK